MSSSHNLRSTTKSTAANAVNDAPKPLQAQSSVPKKPSSKADGKAETKSTKSNAANTIANSSPKKKKPAGKAKTTTTKPKPCSADVRAALLKGINDKGIEFLDRYETKEIPQLIKSIGMPVRVQGGNRELLLKKLQQALNLKGLGIDEDGQEIPLDVIFSDSNIAKDIIKDVQDASTSNSGVELNSFFERLMGYYPVNSNNGATNEAVAGEIIEFLGSKGDRFFHNKDTAWLCKKLGRSATSRPPLRRKLVRDLRIKRGYTYLNYQLPALDAHRDGNVTDVAKKEAIGGTADTANCAVPTAAAGDNLEMNALLTDVSLRNENVGFIVNGAGNHGNQTINCHTGVLVNFNGSSYLSESKIEKLVDDAVEKRMAAKK